MQAKLIDYHCNQCGKNLAAVCRHGGDISDGDIVLCIWCGFVGSLEIDDDGEVTIIEGGEE